MSILLRRILIGLLGGGAVGGAYSYLMRCVGST